MMELFCSFNKIKFMLETDAGVWLWDNAPLIFGRDDITKDKLLEGFDRICFSETGDSFPA